MRDDLFDIVRDVFGTAHENLGCPGDKMMPSCTINMCPLGLPSHPMGEKDVVGPLGHRSDKP